MSILDGLVSLSRAAVATCVLPVDLAADTLDVVTGDEPRSVEQRLKDVRRKLAKAGKGQ